MQEEPDEDVDLLSDKSEGIQNPQGIPINPGQKPGDQAPVEEMKEANNENMLSAFDPMAEPQQNDLEDDDPLNFPE